MKRRPQNRSAEVIHLTAKQANVYSWGWQPEARFRDAVCGRRFGKALALDTPIPTRAGWTTMGAILEGDRLFDEHGNPCSVTFATDVMYGRPCFRVGFSDGTSVVADADHLWLTWDRCARKNAARNGRKVRVRLNVKAAVNERPKVRSTAEILATLHANGRGDTNHSIQPCGPIQCEEASLTIPPYVLGAWLGDGTSVNATITCHIDDAQIIDEIRREGEPAHKGKHVNSWCLGYRRSDIAGRTSRDRPPLICRLRALGVLGNKHVPAEYKRASVAQRVALLQGLMDTDGSASALGHCEFTSTSPVLVQSMAEIARSLGIRAVIGEGVATLNGRIIGPKWRVTFTTDLPVFRLKRKLDRLLSRRGKVSRNINHRFITSVEAVESVPVRCIQVDSPNRLYLCGESFIPTHNTFLGAAEIRRAAMLAAKWKVSPDDEIWYCAPTFKQAKRVFWRRLKRAIPRDWLDGKPNESECHMALRSGHMIRVVGLDAYDNLRGSGLFFGLIDEWADCPVEAWEEVIEPMLGTVKYTHDGIPRHGGHILRIGTPKGFNHCYDSYVRGQPGGEPDHKSWIYTTIQGGNVPADEVDKARRTKDPRTFRQEYEATFESYSGTVYYAFARKESVKPCPYDRELPIHVGMDFNVNPMSATVWQERPNGELWQVGEIVIPTSNTHEMARELETRYGRPEFGSNRLKHITVYPDPAGAQRRSSAQGETDLSILHKAGFSVLAMSSHPLVRDRINLLNAQFLNAEGKRTAFVDPSCRESITCYEQLVYKEGTSEPDKDTGLDHLPDATGYYVYARFAYKPPKFTTVHHMGR